MSREKAEAVVLDWMDDLDPSGINTERWKVKFKSMDDKAFDDFVKLLREGKDYISIVNPNYSKVKVSTANNFKVAKKRGVKLFQRLWITDPITGVKYLSNDEYPVFHLPIRRQIQMTRNKISVAKDNSKIDSLTGQPTGSSSAGAISYPESLVLYSRGLEKTMQELVWARGGNHGAFLAMNNVIKDSGRVSLNELEAHSTGVDSTRVLNTYFKAAHIDNNI